MSVPKSIWEQLEQLNITTTGPKHYPYFACWDFEARICQHDQVQFTPFPASDAQLPPHQADNKGTFIIPEPDLSQLDNYCYIIATQQPCIFDIRVTVVYHLTKDVPGKQRRRCIIEPTNIIHNATDYHELFTPGRILTALETAQLISPQVLIEAVEFKVARKQLLFTSTLKPISFAVNSNVPGYNVPVFDVCDEDDEDAVRRLLTSFIDKLNAISDETYNILHREHDAVFDKLRYGIF